MKFLIDECLSPRLAHLARSRGHHEATHVSWIGWQGSKDWVLIRFAVENDYILVTANAEDFRGPAANPGSAGLHAAVALHPGLICLNRDDDRLDGNDQLRLFAIALDDLAADADLVNRALEVTLLADDVVSIDRYPVPRAGPYAR